jgi:hypothetical protein
MENEQIRVRLTPAAGDPAHNSAEYQADLDAFDKTLRSHGIVPQRVLETLTAAAGVSEPVWLGQFVIITKAITPIVTSVIVAAIGGYFHGRRGRRASVEIKTGKDRRIKITAQSPEEVERAFEVLLAESRKVLEAPEKRIPRGKKPKGS